MTPSPKPEAEGKRKGVCPIFLFWSSGPYVHVFAFQLTPNPSHHVILIIRFRRTFHYKSLSAHIYGTIK